MDQESMEILDKYFYENFYKGNCSRCGKEIKSTISTNQCIDCEKFCGKCDTPFEKGHHLQCIDCGEEKCLRCKANPKILNHPMCGGCNTAVQKLLSNDERKVFRNKVQAIYTMTIKSYNDLMKTLKKAELHRRLDVLALRKEEQRLEDKGIDVDLTSKMMGPVSLECANWCVQGKGEFATPYDFEETEPLFTEDKDRLEEALSVINEEIKYTLNEQNYYNLHRDFSGLEEEVKTMVGKKIIAELKVKDEFSGVRRRYLEENERELMGKKFKTMEETLEARVLGLRNYVHYLEGSIMKLREKEPYEEYLLKQVSELATENKKLMDTSEVQKLRLLNAKLEEEIKELKCEYETDPRTLEISSLKETNKKLGSQVARMKRGKERFLEELKELRLENRKSRAIIKSLKIQLASRNQESSLE